MFWHSTPGEVGALLTQIQEREQRTDKRARERAGLIAATMVNAWSLDKGDDPVQPMDFWRTTGEVERMSPAEAVQHFNSWARRQNQKVH